MLPVRKNNYLDKYGFSDEYLFPSNYTYRLPSTNNYDVDIESIRSFTNIRLTELNNEYSFNIERLKSDTAIRLAELNYDFEIEKMDRMVSIESIRNFSNVLINRPDADSLVYTDGKGGLFGKKNKTSIRLGR